ncbi:MAG: hypothetical protein K2W95_25040 [Candidatus Obscuribacterales bacterium]|nr:hypothetical protein [Candidatus Obscuribacterales bacterium]
MKELEFTYGRLNFCGETYQMLPCLPDNVEVRIQLYYIDEDGLMESGFHSFDDLAELKSQKSVVWMHITGVANDEFWKELRRLLDLSDNQIKLLRSPHRRSYTEDFAEGVFWSLQRPSVTDNIDALETVNFLITENFMVTRQFSHDNAFSLVTHKLMAKGQHIAAYGSDRLAAELLGDIINSYLDLLKTGGTKLEAIQNKIIRNPGKQELELINRSQQLIWIFLNAVWPVEIIMQSVVHSRNPVIGEEGREDFRARMAEAQSVLRLFETYRAMSYDLMDVYVSGLGLRTNETTMILTIIATLFLPPTLIAGVYGMNFTIPEIHWEGGYYVCLASMFVVSGGLLIWLKTRGYIRF